MTNLPPRLRLELRQPPRLELAQATEAEAPETEVCTAPSSIPWQRQRALSLLAVQAAAADTTTRYLPHRSTSRRQGCSLERRIPWMNHRPRCS